jgi:hypothetical protein
MTIDQEGLPSQIQYKHVQDGPENMSVATATEETATGSRLLFREPLFSLPDSRREPQETWELGCALAGFPWGRLDDQKKAEGRDEAVAE